MCLYCGLQGDLQTRVQAIETCKLLPTMWPKPTTLLELQFLGDTDVRYSFLLTVHPFYVKILLPWFLSAEQPHFFLSCYPWERLQRFCLVMLFPLRKQRAMALSFQVLQSCLCTSSSHWIHLCLWRGRWEAHSAILPVWVVPNLLHDHRDIVRKKGRQIIFYLVLYCWKDGDFFNEVLCGVKYKVRRWIQDSRVFIAVAL